jgi:gephyrin
MSGQHSDVCSENVAAAVPDLPPAAGAQPSIVAEAYAFRKLVAHLQQRTDVHNIDVMNLTGFCRNCLSKWYAAGMQAQGRPIAYEDACEQVYGMPYSRWKKDYQSPATAEQMALFESTKPLHAKHPKAAPPPAPAPASAPAPAPAPVPAGSSSASRKSTYPMTDVDDALASVLEHTLPLPAEPIKAADALGRILREDVAAVEPLPPFAASILDGYAMRFADGAGDYPVAGRIVAGVDPQFTLQPGEVAYITTGAKLPEGADCVVKYEDTELLQEENGEEKMVRIFKGATAAGKDVRKIGVDIAEGSRVIAAPTALTPAEIGLCASVGATTLSVSRLPVVGVLSTGDELLSPDEPLSPGKIRDCNRSTLLSWAASQLPAEVIDLGITRDAGETLQKTLADAATRCDVILTSGGVSMGEADLLKQVLPALGGTIHFGRLNMKPGKPTTFAVLPRPQAAAAASESSAGQCLVFALPGNPVSCLVTAHLLAGPALKRMSGMPVAECMHPQVDARLPASVTMDPERPEYHRCSLKWDSSAGCFVAYSTGVQRSSRLLSMHGANAVLAVPKGKGSLEAGSFLPAMLIDQLSSPHPDEAFHRRAAGGRPAAAVNAPAAIATTAAAAAVNLPKPAVRVCVLTVSDRASRGEYADETGPAVVGSLQAPTATIAAEIQSTRVVPDEAEDIAAAVREWSGGEAAADLIITAGGTGFAPRDVTPEAVAPLIERAAPGLVHALLSAAAITTAPSGGLGLVSRPVAGTRGGTLIVTLPGSPRAAQQQLAALMPLLPRIYSLMKS